MSYRDGVMEHEPKACAAVKGTQIMVKLSNWLNKRVILILEFCYVLGGEFVL